MSEKWKVINGTEGIYQVSNLGRIRRMRGYGTSRRAKVWPIRYMKGSLDNRGYPQVCLSVHNVSSTKKIHPLVARYFIGPRPAGMVVNHKDGDKQNNRSSNLEYITQKENMHHAYALGLEDRFKLSKLPPRPIKLSSNDVTFIRDRIMIGDSRSWLADFFGIHVMTVGEIVRGEIWKHVCH